MAAASIVVDLLMKTGSFETDTKRAENRMRALKKSSGELASSIRGLAAAFGIGFSVAGIVKIADTYSTLQSRLRLVTESSNQLLDVQQKLLDIANRQRVPLDDTATLYSRSAAAAKELGASQEDLLKFTEGVSAALTINGTSAQAASGALLQLSQAIGGSVIQAQEFNSLIDGARPLLQAVADNLDGAGGSVAKLTQLVKSGQVTSKAFFDAAVKGSDDLIKKVEEIPPTVSQAFTVLTNNILVYVGLIDSATGATNGLAQAIIDFSKSDILRVPLETLGVLGANIAYVFKQVGNEIGGIAAQLSALLSGDFNRFSEIGRMMREDAKKAREEIDRISEQILNRQPVLAAPSSTPSIPLIQISDTKDSKRKSKRDFELQEFVKQQQEIANLIQQAQEAAGPELSRADQLQKELDAYSQIDPAIKSYIQDLINVSKAKEQIEAFQKFDDAEIEEIAKAEEARQQDIEQAMKDYDQFYTQLIEENENLTVDLIQNDKERVAAQLALEYDRRVAVINSMRIEADERAKLLEISEENYEKLVKKSLEVTDEITQFWKKAAENMQDAMSDFFFDAMQGNLNDLAGSFKRTIDRMVADLLASQLLDFLVGDIAKSGELGGFLGDLFGGLFNAKGNAFNQQGVMAFANGGIVNGPTPFTFGGGNLGVMGEAGPEAILPLSRNSQGKLGVVGGGNITMNIYTPDANSFRKSQPQIMAETQRSLRQGQRVV